MYVRPDRSTDMNNMEELHVAAAAYYSYSSRQLQQLAKDFFRSMDMNGDGQVSFIEFVAFFRQCGYNWPD
jgi:Ca2+-binding EF-hand superfamily protein